MATSTTPPASSRQTNHQRTGNGCTPRSFLLHPESIGHISLNESSNYLDTKQMTTYKVGFFLAVGFGIGFRFCSARLGFRVVPVLHHEVLHRFGFLLRCQYGARLNFTDFRFQERLGSLQNPLLVRLVGNRSRLLIHKCTYLSA